MKIFIEDSKKVNFKIENMKKQKKGKRNLRKLARRFTPYLISLFLFNHSQLSIKVENLSIQVRCY